MGRRRARCGGDMSAGMAGSAPVDHSLALLAPRFRDAVQRALEGCRQGGLDAVVYEAYRSAALQAVYFARGRTVIPPAHPVTNASSNLYSWHGYGLAVDVISASRAWEAPESWFADVARVFAGEGC